MEQVCEKKRTFTEIFSKATFTLNKWNPNEQELEVEERVDTPRIEVEQRN